MFEKAASYIREHDLLRAGDRVVAGVSGGADSVCLLHVLVRLRGEMGLTVHAVHVHHGLRGEEADRDAAFVEKLAAEWNVPCRVVHVDVQSYAAANRLSEEEAGRILRYRALAEEAERLGKMRGTDHADGARDADGYDPAAEPCAVKIAVGHQREDQAETILHNLFRGSSLKGLAGMAPSGVLRVVPGEPVNSVGPGSETTADEEYSRRDPAAEACDGLCLIRPLLCVSRVEIRAYLEENGLTCCEDSTNGSEAYTRNRIRQLLPQICRDVNARAVDHILAAGQRMALADAYFEEEAARIWAESGVAQERSDHSDAAPGMRQDPQMGGPGKRCGIPAAVLGGLPEILAGYLAMKMIRLMAGSVKDITACHADQICDLARMGTGKRVSLPYGLCAVREYEMVWVEKRSGADCAASGVFSEDPAAAFTFSRFPYEKNMKIPENRYTKWFDYDRIEGALSVRTRQTGDYITLKGGCRKSVKSYMIDEKIPRGERDRILMLAEGNHVLWIAGYRISEYYKVTEETKEILQVRAGGVQKRAGESPAAGGRSGTQERGGESYVREDTGIDSGRRCE